LYLFPDRAVRLVNRVGASHLQGFLKTAAARELLANGQLVSTSFVDPNLHSSWNDQTEFDFGDEDPVIVEHERVHFRSFPYEWPPQMLYAAARLMLQIAELTLKEGYALKDATPYNILFRGPQPVFVDLLSFERREPTDPTWLPLNQFTRTFLLPLLVNKFFRIPLDQLLTAQRDGLEPTDVVRLCGPLRKLHPLFLSLVFLPHWLNGKKFQRNEAIYEKRGGRDPEQATFILQQQFKRLRKQLAKLAPAEEVSHWSNYMAPNQFFSEAYLAAKEDFVRRVLDDLRPTRVLDIGCNTGHFSRIAARRGASVVALDQDPVVVDSVWKRASAEDLDVLPLVVNLARPTPGIGWRNEECPSFLDRAHEDFDMVFMLAVLHHLLVSEQVSLPDVLKLASELTSEHLLIEFVTPQDPMFQLLVRGRAELFRELSPQTFELAAERWFEAMRVAQLSETRWLYLLRKRSTAGNA